MAGAYRRSQQLYGLLREFLTLCYALGGSKRPRGALVVFPLFAIELGPLSLVSRLEQGAMTGTRTISTHTLDSTVATVVCAYQSDAARCLTRRRLKTLAAA
jgi:hypothetical protein